MTRQEMEHLLDQWRRAEAVAEGYQAVHEYRRTAQSRVTAEVMRREANDLKERILEATTSGVPHAH